jgi:hypothetical protein
MGMETPKPMMSDAARELAEEGGDMSAGLNPETDNPMPESGPAEHNETPAEKQPSQPWRPDRADTDPEVNADPEWTPGN